MRSAGVPPHLRETSGGRGQGLGQQQHREALRGRRVHAHCGVPAMSPTLCEGVRVSEFSGDLSVLKMYSL